MAEEKILNEEENTSSKETKELFLNEFNKVYKGIELSKTCLACIQYIQQ